LLPRPVVEILETKTETFTVNDAKPTDRDSCELYPEHRLHMLHGLNLPLNNNNSFLPSGIEYNNNNNNNNN